ncbi:MAG: hypothetical protein EOO73_33355 [Myxococcales bacterium]|nr:MAG: hypothetical protein EOO73_33355 [Myxococcales bacterium]
MMILTGAVALHASLASAAPEPTTTALVDQGLALRRARQDQAALAAFQQAYQREEKPMILAQIALAEQALGRFLEAEGHLTQSLDTNDTWIEQHRPALEKALSAIAARLAWLEVTVSPPDAELRLDEQPLPLASSPFRLAAGPHALELRAASGATLRRSIELGPGERHVYRLELPTPSIAPPSSAPAPLAPTAYRRAQPSSPSPVAPSRRFRSWAYASATLASVALLEAVAASLVRQGYIDDYNAPECAPDRSQRCAAYRRSANTFGTVAVVGYAVAGAAGLTSFALFAEPWWSRPGAPPASAVVGVSAAF